MGVPGLLAAILCEAVLLSTPTSASASQLWLVESWKAFCTFIVFPGCHPSLSTADQASASTELLFTCHTPVAPLAPVVPSVTSTGLAAWFRDSQTVPVFVWLADPTR